jgi:hypothetical protein
MSALNDMSLLTKLKSVVLLVISVISSFQRL